MERGETGRYEVTNVGGEPVRGSSVLDVNLEALGIDLIALHNARAGYASQVTGVTPMAWNNRYVSCALNQDPLNPTWPYRPFCMDDALALLWRENNVSNANYTVRGRIADVLGEPNIRNKRGLLNIYCVNYTVF